MSSIPPIVCALSGGVDSAVAAAMLVEQGENVVGMTMRLYDASGTTASVGGRCCGPRDIEDARQVCAHLGIPHYVVDFEREFQERVIDDFTRSYMVGETPNPCVKCNQYIKFSPLLQRSKALGADILATGHYARLEADDSGHVWLRRGLDPGKDQSYFLFSMPTTDLAAIRFPLGGLTKETVRQEATRLGLPNAQKTDSQEICFVPDGDYAGFVERNSPISIPRSGPIVDQEGNEVGRHRGLHRYTVGQRRGLGDVTSDGEPVYVIKIDMARNQLVVGPSEAAKLSAISVRDLRWLSPERQEPFETTVQVRHRSTPVPCTVTPRGTVASVSFTSEAPIAAPGQAAVFYDNDRVVAGGWVSSSA